MERFYRYLKYELRKPDNGLMQVLILHVLLSLFYYACMVLFYLQGWLLGDKDLAASLTAAVALSGQPGSLLTKPWTLLTYFFVQNNLLSLLLYLGWVFPHGRLVFYLLGNRRFLALYLGGGIAGAAFYFLAKYWEPEKDVHLLGSMAAGYALAAGALSFAPNYARIYWGLPVPLRLTLCLPFLFLAKKLWDRQLEGVAGLGGTLWGFGYSFYLQRRYEQRQLWRVLQGYWHTYAGWLSGQRWLQPLSKFFRASSAATHKTPGEPGGHAIDLSSPDRQTLLHLLLDKVARHGYHSLTAPERRVLLDLSKNQPASRQGE